MRWRVRDMQQRPRIAIRTDRQRDPGSASVHTKTRRQNRDNYGDCHGSWELSVGLIASEAFRGRVPAAAEYSSARLQSS